MTTLYLVACAKTKQPGTHPAEELYTSPLFRKSVAWVKQQLQAGDVWWILSAKHVVLRPGQSVESYDLTLSALSRTERDAWSYSLWRDHLQPKLTGPRQVFDRVVFLAGIAYWRTVVWHMNHWMEHRPTREGWDIEVPLQGMMIGERLQWLTAHTQEAA